MKGLELAEGYFREYGLPMLEREFPDLLPKLAAGLIGEGSECLGYDDAVSTDHDFEPGFCLFLPDEEETVDRRTAFLLEKAYAKLPRDYMGYRRQMLAPVGGARHGVFRIGDYLEKKIGRRDEALPLASWFALPEQALLELTCGRLRVDTPGMIALAPPE